MEIYVSEKAKRLFLVVIVSLIRHREVFPFQNKFQTVYTYYFFLFSIFHLRLRRSAKRFQHSLTEQCLDYLLL